MPSTARRRTALCGPFPGKRAGLIFPSLANTSQIQWGSPVLPGGVVVLCDVLRSGTTIFTAAACLRVESNGDLSHRRRHSGPTPLLPGAGECLRRESRRRLQRRPQNRDCLSLTGLFRVSAVTARLMICFR
jgi:hypothetical protein